MQEVQEAFGSAQEVQRDMDLIREILRFIEQNPQMDGRTTFPITSPEDLGVANHSMDEVAYALRLLSDAGFIDASSNGKMLRRLTWEGHEFLDNIKTDSIWETVKKQASGLTGVDMKVLASLAEAEVKQRLGLR